MQSANNPISHHTSHTMGQGAASSNSGDNRSGGNCLDHHTNHSIGAASSDSVALGGDGVVEVSDGETGKEFHAFIVPWLTRLPIGDDQGCVLETSVTGLDINELHPIATTVSNESENSDSASDGRSSGATSVRSTGSLNNFSIIDTTLREGEQFATAYFDTATKIKIAQALDDIGVEYVSP